jgi:hypothetical protein
MVVDTGVCGLSASQAKADAQLQDLKVRLGPAWSQAGMVSCLVCM